MKKIICSCGNDKWAYQYTNVGTGTSWDIYGCTNCSNTHTVEIKDNVSDLNGGVVLYEDETE